MCLILQTIWATIQGTEIAEDIFGLFDCCGTHMKKNSMPKYWDPGVTVKTPFCETYMGRNMFKIILSKKSIS